MRPDSRRPATLTLRLRRRSWREWVGVGLWLLTLAILADFALANWRLHEQLAAVITSLTFGILLLAGIVLNLMWGLENWDRADLAARQESHETAEEP